MKALQPIKAGEEIFNDYGTLPRSDLLRRYGYITPNYAQYDVVEVSHDLIVESAKAGERMSEEDFNDRVRITPKTFRYMQCLINTNRSLISRSKKL